MKTSNQTLLTVAFALLTLTSCRNDDATMLTVVNADGTCTRDISFLTMPQARTTPADEALDVETMHIDTTWTRTWEVAEADSGRVVLHVSRQFQTVGELGDALSRVVGAPFRATARLEKRFKWFYTDYTFTETFSLTDREAYFRVPVQQFVGADTASYWFTGQPLLTQGMSGAEQKELLDDVEERISRWLNVNTFDYLYRYIADSCYSDVQRPPVSREQFLTRRDSILRLPVVQHLSPLNIIEQAADILRDVYHCDAFTPILADSVRMQQPLERIYHDLQLITLLNFRYDLVMPGRTRAAGNGVADENVIHYRLTGERLLPGDYVLTATSRTTNVWAFLVSLLVVLTATGSFAWKWRGKVRGGTLALDDGAEAEKR